MADIDDVVIIANQINLALSITAHRLEQIENRIAEQNEILKNGLFAIAYYTKEVNTWEKCTPDDTTSAS